MDVEDDREMTISQVVPIPSAPKQAKPRIPRQKLIKMPKNMTDPY
jgi:hypothetical protein